MNIVILAAGKGSRMKSSLTKVLHQIGGKPMITHVVETAASLRPKKILVVVSENRKEIENELKNLNINFQIKFVDQKPTLGTGHAVMMASPLLDETCNTLILFGDVPLISPGSLKKLCKESNQPFLRVLTAIVENPSGYGRIIRDGNEKLIKKCIEEKDANKTERNTKEINTGIMYVSTKNLIDWVDKIDNKNEQHEYYLPQIISHANNENISVFPVLTIDVNEILGVNSPLQKSNVERIFQKKYAKEFCEKGLEISDINRFDVRGNLSFGKEVKIDIGCLFIGEVSIGNEVIIEPYCVIKNTSIGNHTIVKAFTHIENSVVGSNSIIGPYARLRANTEIENNCKIGNFVETKNIELGANSKANHLSYLGDAQIGKNVNIGAGTITCNYDGNKKHKTTIEDDSFIGSNSELIAPVTIKKGATVGAGTTLCEDVPEKSLSTSRAKQVNIIGWKKSNKS